MAFHDLWHAWLEGLRSSPNRTAKLGRFLATGAQGPCISHITYIISIRQEYYNMLWNVTQIKSTTTVKDDSNWSMERDRAWLFREAAAPLILMFLNNCVVEWVLIDILKELHSLKKIRANILPGNHYFSQNQHKNYGVNLRFYRHGRSFIWRECSSAATHVHFAEVPYTPVLRIEVKMYSDKTTARLTSYTGNVFDCIKWYQKWRF